MSYLKSCALVSVLLCLAPEVASAKKVRIKVGTVAPEGSIWHNALRKIGQRWRKLSDEQVRLKIYPGGVAGDEGDMVRKMRIGQLHMAAVTGVGLQQITRSTLAMQMPMLFDSWEMVDAVRQDVGPLIAEEMLAKDFVVLSWGDAGIAHMFSRKLSRTCEDYKGLRFRIWDGDPASEKVWRAVGFQPIPLSSTDMLSGLQTGMVDAFGTAPIFALSSQWFGLAKSMVRVNWSFLNGAIVVSKKQWQKIPAEIRPALKQAADEVSAELNLEVRALHRRTIEAMSARGLQILDPTPSELEDWRACAAAAIPHYVREGVVPERAFKMILKAADQHKKKQPPTTPAPAAP